MSRENVIERTFQTPGAVALDLRIPSGRIDVETADVAETYVELRADSEESIERATVELRDRGGTYELVVEVEKKRTGLFGGAIDISIGDFGFQRNQYRLKVRCPRDPEGRFATASADVYVHGRLRSLEAKTASGDVSGDDVLGDAAVKTASGDVKLQTIGGEARINTVSGDVHLHSVAQPLTVQVVSGDVRVEAAGSSVGIKSVSGDVWLNAVVEGDVTVTSVSGDVQVGIRRGSSVQVDATTVSGTMSSELELGEAPPGGADDGPLVDVRAKTVSGDVRLARAPARAELPA